MATEISSSSIRWRAYASILLCLIGAILSVITVVEHLNAALGIMSPNSLCHINATVNCEAVLKSPYSIFLGFPLGAYGFAFYVVVLFVSLFAKQQDSVRSVALSKGMLFLTLAASLVSVVLFSVSSILIKALCPFCIGTYLVNFILLALWASLFSGNGIFGNAQQGGSVVLFGFPALVLGVSRHAAKYAMQARGALLAGVVIVAVSLFLPTLIGERLALSIAPQNNQGTPDKPVEKDPEKLIAEAVAAWEAAPVTDLKNEFSGALTTDYAIGPVNAPIQIVEFSDFECPACRYFYTVLEQILRENGDKVRLVYRNYPLDRNCNPIIPRDMHQHACYAAEIARCSGEQGKFWDVANYLLAEAFEDEGAEFNAVRTRINASIERFGLDAQAVRECMQSGRQGKKILEDINLGTSFKLQGTPSLWVNGKRLEHVNEQVLRRVIKKLL